MDNITHSFGSVSVTQGREFSITSLAAFDELMDTGVAIEYPNNESPTGALIQAGYKVELDIVAMTWDGASTSTNVFANGKLAFIVGQDQVARGLDAAMLKLWNGAKVSCTPTHSLTLTYLLTHSLTYLLTYLLTYSLTYSLTHLLTYLLTHSRTYSLTHLLTCLLTLSLI